eukprot:5636840-Heterocapsa_arctica.AAC.1
MHLQVAGVEDKVRVWRKAKPCQPKQAVGPHLDHGQEWEDLVKDARAALLQRGDRTFCVQKECDLQQLSALWGRWNEKATSEARGRLGHEGPMGEAFEIKE